MNTKVKDFYTLFKAELDSGLQRQGLNPDALPSLLALATVNNVFFFKALNASRKGDYARALVFAVLWAGSVNNSNTQVRMLMKNNRGW